MTTMTGQNMTERRQCAFWRKVDVSGGPDACWPWTGARHGFGHGQFRLGRSVVQAHRLAYELATGAPIPPGLVVRHRCNNPCCVNPAHLAIGTHADNVADRVAAGRSATGEHNGRAKLSLTEAQAIRAAQGTATAAELARRYGVNRRTVTLIWQGRNWRTVLAAYPTDTL